MQRAGPHSDPPGGFVKLPDPGYWWNNNVSQLFGTLEVQNAIKWNRDTPPTSQIRSFNDLMKVVVEYRKLVTMSSEVYSSLARVAERVIIGGDQQQIAQQNTEADQLDQLIAKSVTAYTQQQPRRRQVMKGKVNERFDIGEELQEPQVAPQVMPMPLQVPQMMDQDDAKHEQDEIPAVVWDK